MWVIVVNENLKKMFFKRVGKRFSCIIKNWKMLVFQIINICEKWTLVRCLLVISLTRKQAKNLYKMVSVYKQVKDCRLVFSPSIIVIFPLHFTLRNIIILLLILLVHLFYFYACIFCNFLQCFFLLFFYSLRSSFSS